MSPEVGFFFIGVVAGLGIGWFCWARPVTHCREQEQVARVFRRGSNVNPGPTNARPPAPKGPPPMADTIFGCDEHYYGGCPNCGRGRWPGPR